MNRRIIFAAFIGMIFLSFSKLYGQEILMPLQYNIVIKKYLDTHQVPDGERAIVCDTVLLPFVDDFSRDGIYPFDCLWTDSAVFINDDFADNPPTFGVATFDGVN